MRPDNRHCPCTLEARQPAVRGRSAPSWELLTPEARENEVGNARHATTRRRRGRRQQLRSCSPPRCRTSRWGPPRMSPAWVQVRGLFQLSRTTAVARDFRTKGMPRLTRSTRTMPTNCACRASSTRGMRATFAADRRIRMRCSDGGDRVIWGARLCERPAAPSCVALLATCRAGSNRGSKKPRRWSPPPRRLRTVHTKPPPIRASSSSSCILSARSGLSVTDHPSRDRGYGLQWT